MRSIEKFDPSQARDPHGRWTRAAAAVALRSTRIAAHAVHLHAAVTAAVNAPLPEAIMHAHTALARAEALLSEIQALPSDARELGAETARKLRAARDGLVRLRARLSATRHSHAGVPA